MFEFFYQGVLGLPWWGYVIYTLVVTHLTIISVTIFLHRCQSHRAAELHPLPSHIFRLCLWMTTGMVTREWVAIHRKHHAKCETPDDPHSPYFFGIRKVLLEGSELYREASKDSEMLAKYGHGTPSDWIERNCYGRYHWHGLILMLIVDVVLLGLPGITVFAVQMMWIPIFAAGVINGLGHWWGYRNYETADGSTNIVPWGMLIGGEELHNNHHAYPGSAKLASRAWEIDLGWVYLRALSKVGLAKIKRVAPRPVIDPNKVVVDIDTVKAVVLSRMHVLENYARRVILPVHKAELARSRGHHAHTLLKRARQALIREETRRDATSRGRLSEALENSNMLQTVYDYRARLQAIWDNAASNDKLLKSLQDWCAQAEASGINALQDFAIRLRGYSLQPQLV
jgi:stearoyl-CoA desaturase (delta-9 desaturase)